ncbi:MAG TPA: class I SAM-dependent methyltransferase, partial [Marinagarivorans sp.]|nr:class I SAM-dependent methyltransferase [Marinagarivorans sp.]
KLGLWLNGLAHDDLADYASAQLAIAPSREKPQGCSHIVEFSADGVQLHDCEHSHYKPLKLDFTLGGAAHRRKFGGGAGQMIAKAVGISGKITPHVLDATAGLGGDAFVVACLGCQVTLLERSPIAYVLLADALKRARQFAAQNDSELMQIIERMQLVPGNSIEYLKTCQQNYPVIYLDPMFPERQKSAAVKKEMQLFHALIGKDDDSAELFAQALPKAWCRLVVKRPRLAPQLTDTKVNLVLEGKSCRFDIYTQRKITAESLAECEAGKSEERPA